MFPGDPVVGALVGVFDDDLEILDTVRVRVTTHVLTVTVVDRVVSVATIHHCINDVFVGIKSPSRLGLPGNERGQIEGIDLVYDPSADPAG